MAAPWLASHSDNAATRTVRPEGATSRVMPAGWDYSALRLLISFSPNVSHELAAAILMVRCPQGEHQSSPSPRLRGEGRGEGPFFELGQQRLAAVELDDQTPLSAYKVGVKTKDGLLADELKPPS
jgi:hypothetical protein